MSGVPQSEIPELVWADILALHHIAKLNFISIEEWYISEYIHIYTYVSSKISPILDKDVKHKYIQWCTATIVNSLVPGRFQFNFRKVILKLTLVNGSWGVTYEIALRWTPQDLTDDKSTLVQVMAWCCQAISHYLSQCWPKSMSPNDDTRPQWVNSIHGQHWSR